MLLFRLNFILFEQILVVGTHRFFCVMIMNMMDDGVKKMPV